MDNNFQYDRPNSMFELAILIGTYEIKKKNDTEKECSVCHLKKQDTVKVNCLTPDIPDDVCYTEDVCLECLNKAKEL